MVSQNPAPSISPERGGILEERSEDYVLLSKTNTDHIIDEERINVDVEDKMFGYV